jgi:glutamate---cysteine ligase / carboxylate-amine ligase
MFSVRSFRDPVAALRSTGAISDGTKIYWDMCPSARFETIEFRITDVCITVDEAAMIAGLARGLARTCYDAAIAGAPPPKVRSELLRSREGRSSAAQPRAVSARSSPTTNGSRTSSTS